MVIENPLPQFIDWFPLAARDFTFAAFGILLLVLFAAALMFSIQYGPLVAGDRLFALLRSLLGDILYTSPRRVWALARLAVQESVRRLVLAANVLFIIILMFAGWFLGTEMNNAAALHLNFVLTAISWLLLLEMLVLAAISLPTDFKNKTLYTVVTKPVRVTEIVLGRVLGFVFIGTVMLAIMGAVSYVFIVRELSHTHKLAAADLQPEPSQPGQKSVSLQGTTSKSNKSNGHSHRVLVKPDAKEFATDVAAGHWHQVTVTERNGKPVYTVSGPRGDLVARVPRWGKLRFLDRSQQPAKEGVNVGDEWAYRSYIEGGTLAAAIWQFDDVSEREFPDGLPIELTVSVFRTYKGEIKQGILGSLVLRKPGTDIETAPRNFRAKEFYTDDQFIPRKLKDSKGRDIDLFKDIVTDGKVEVQLTCLQRGQYFGMAQPDIYLLASEIPFGANFLKGLFGLWLQMVLVVVFGVMFSTFLNGAVAMLATMALLIGGINVDMLNELAENRSIGGGPFESWVKILNQQSISTPLDPGAGASVVHFFDYIYRGPIWLVSHILPPIDTLSDVDFVAQGFSIPANNITIHLLTTLAFAVPALLLAFAFLKSREVAK